MKETTLIKLEAKKALSQIEMMAIRDRIRFELAGKNPDLMKLLVLHKELAAQRTLKRMATRKLIQAQGK